MTPRDRFLCALHGREPDRPVLVHVAAMTTVETQASTGCFMPDAHRDPAKQARLMAANHELLGFDAIGFLINYFAEPAALGVEMDWGAPDRLPMYRSHPWREPGDAVIPGDALSRAPLATCLETLRIARREYGGLGVVGKVMGPLSFVQVMHGLEPTMIGLLEDPERIERFLGAAESLIVPYANAQLAAGADAIAIGEGGAGANMLSPEMYERVLRPVHARLTAAIRGPTILHMCGDITPRLEALAGTGLTCFNFDWAIAPRAMVEAAAGRFSVMGNVHTGHLLNGPEEEIARQVEACLEAGVRLISPGCAVSPRCPNRHLRAMADAAARCRL